MKTFVALLLLAATLTPCFSQIRAKRAAPIVIAHRGASGYMPEHTLAAYRLAVEQGADFIEPDLVSTKDGVLVARHENEISGTTDVGARSEFAARRATKVIDGASLTGWFTEDFTLAELKQLRCRERIPQLRPQNAEYDGRFEIPTLQEVIDLAKSMSRKVGRRVGVYPETKHPTYFRSVGLPLEEKLVRTLHRNGFRGKRDPAFIQSFEVGNLRALRKMTRLRLVQLLDAKGGPYDLAARGDKRTYADMITQAGLADVATYADGIGPNKDLIVPRDRDNKLLPHTSLVADAHAAGLVVHPFTFRRENYFLSSDLRAGSPDDPAYLRLEGKAGEEYRLFFGLGVDGLFSDNPDAAVAGREPQASSTPGKAQKRTGSKPIR
ncbi:MAG: glycerophosphodiester phosphodiesterase [Rubrivivax sp.]|nr:glycerophosphodiester phosphodiesterase [Pyrinomonadaceae bacterium]